MIQIQDAKTKFFASKEAYLQFKAAWAKLAQAKCIESNQLVFYNLVRGKPSNNGFTPITKPSKLANGCRANGAYEDAMRGVEYWLRKEVEPKHFLGSDFTTITVETLRSLRESSLRT